MGRETGSKRDKIKGASEEKNWKKVYLQKQKIKQTDKGKQRQENI